MQAKYFNDADKYRRGARKAKEMQICNLVLPVGCFRDVLDIL